MGHRPSLAQVRHDIVSCERCPRLRTYCRKVGETKKAAYREQTYWAKPVPGFGDPLARILILGLAPAAHGANRTGRVFTGDGRGGSGDFLMAALHRAGFANRSTSERADDGLILTDVYVAAAVRCAPPQNTPTPVEIDRCMGHLAAEVRALPNLQTVVALGQIAWAAWLKLLDHEGLELPRPRPRFAHGTRLRLGSGAAGSRTLGPPSLARLAQASYGEVSPKRPSAAKADTLGTLGTVGTLRTLGTLLVVGCYHPSRQNTNTGRVTPAMYDEVFQRI